MPLSKSGVFTHKELDPNTILYEERGVDILSAYQKTIGVLSGTHALIDLSNEKNEDVNALGSVTYHCVDRTRKTVAKIPHNSFDKTDQKNMEDGAVGVLDMQA